jgi:hypothetical protein
MFKRKYMDFLLALLPLFIGGLIYICFRNENIIFFSWLRYLNIDYSLLRQLKISKNIISLFIIYSLPNGLWVLSGLLILKIFLKNDKKVLIFYSVIFIILSILYEICQLLYIIPGTFDIIDLITIFIFSSFGFFINIYKGKYEKI